MKDYGLPTILPKYLEAKDCRLFLVLVSYSIITENNVAQHSIA